MEPTSPVREQRVRETMERAERIHAEHMAALNELRRRQLGLVESVLNRFSKEQAARILSAIKAGDLEEPSR
jgi:hypothetical protein